MGADQGKLRPPTSNRHCPLLTVHRLLVLRLRVPTCTRCSLAELSPDFVVATGDFVSYRSANGYRELARVLRTLPTGRRGTVAAPGNHDYGWGWRQTDVAGQAAAVRDASATVLRF